MTKLIGITAPYAGSGKDTAALALTEHRGFVRDAFADRMRKAMLALDPIVWVIDNNEEVRLSHLVDFYGWDAAKREYPEIRRLLQRFGTEAGRDIHGTNCWVNLLVNDWLTSGEPDTVVTDCRFSQEAEAIRAYGGYVIEIVRPDHGGLSGAAATHASEAGLPRDLIDLTIYNSGTIAELHEKMLYVVDHFDPTDADA